MSKSEEEIKRLYEEEGIYIGKPCSDCGTDTYVDISNHLEYVECTGCKQSKIKNEVLPKQYHIRVDVLTSGGYEPVEETEKPTLFMRLIYALFLRTYTISSYTIIIAILLSVLVSASISYLLAQHYFSQFP